MEETPLISIVIPCYNSAEFAGEAILSALRQTWSSIEVIVVDDASTDHSASVIRSFGNRVKPVSLRSNSGAAAARNRGAEISTGEALLFLDADDVLGTTAIEELVTEWRRSPGLIAACRFEYLARTGDRWERRPARRRPYSWRPDQLLDWLEGGWSPPCALLWPRAIYESSGGWNESRSRNDDGDLVMRVLARGTRISNASRGMVAYRRHGGSLSRLRSSVVHLESAVNVLLDLTQYLDSQERLAPYSKAIAGDLAETALLAFKAGHNDFGVSTTRMAKQVANGSAAKLHATPGNAPATSEILRSRILASAIRSMAQLRRSRNRRVSARGSADAYLHKAKRIRVLAWPAFRNRRENPYNFLLYSELRLLGVSVKEFSVQRLLFGPPADVLHMHWAPTSRIRGSSRRRVQKTAAELMLLMTAARLRRMKIVWTAHDIGAHDRMSHDDLEGAYWGRIAGYLDGIISLSAVARDALVARYPALHSVPSFMTRHGHYRDSYPRTLGRGETRERLGIAPTARVLAFVGQLRPYKNLPVLLRAFRQIEDPAAVLLVAGMLKLDETREEFDALVAADSRVRVFGGLIKDEEMQLYLESADAVVLPYRDILNSGSALLALSFDRPVLVPSRGSMTELAMDVPNGWVLTYDDELTAAHLSRALEIGIQKAGQQADLSHFDWRVIGEQTRDVYRTLLAAGSR